ncbi:hypothetical protein FKM82_001164 [Ascaphus truei]
MQQQQPTVREAFETVTKFTYNRAVLQNVNVAKMLIDSLHLKCFESQRFRVIMQRGEPRYNIPSRSYFSNDVLPKMYSTALHQWLRLLHS